MKIEIRPVRSHEEYRAVERLQSEVWGLEDAEIVPDHLLLTAQKNGGVVLGAFADSPERDRERLVGFVFGFVGLSPEGGIKHCSHMAGVAPDCQGRSVGYRLKLAQRQHVLAQGINLITWTFDPLESLNARLNFHKLGVVCRTYLRDLYGDMRDALNVGLPSDRFQVSWHISSGHVTHRVSGDWAGPSLAELMAEGVPLLNRAHPGELSRPPEETLPLRGDRLLIQIPANFQAIKSADLALARAWRMHTRALFESAFGANYTVIDLLFEGGRSCYLLRKGWRPR